MTFTVQGLHHIGITVSDLSASFAWYSRMFGLEGGPVNSGEGDELSGALQVPGAALDFSMIEIGDTRIEFLEYRSPEGLPFDRRNCDVGSTHVCLQVSDMDEAYETLRARGAVFNAPPVTLADGSLAGSRWAYLRDPDGIQLEIWQVPAT